MKKRTKKFFCALLALGILCTGCAAPTESEISTSSSTSSEPSQTESQPLSVIEDDGPYHYELETAWSRTDVLEDTLTPTLRRTAEGEILMLEQYYDDGEAQYRISRLKKNGETEEILNPPSKIERWTPKEEGDDTGYPHIAKFDIDEKENIYILYEYKGLGYWTMDIYDKDGNLTTEDRRIDLQDKTFGDIAAAEEFYCRNGLICLVNGSLRLQAETLEGDQIPLSLEELRCFHSLTFDENGILYGVSSINASDGSFEVLQMDPANQFSILTRQKIDKNYFAKISYSRETRRIYLQTETTVRSTPAGEKGSQKELEFGGNVPLTLAVNFYNGLPVVKCFLADGGDLLLSTEKSYQVLNDDKTQSSKKDLYIYRLKRTSGPAPEKKIETTLTVTASYRQDYLENAVRMYQADHPEVEIKWDTLYNTRNEFRPHADEAGQKILTKIMANDVGDIVSVAGMGFGYKDVLETDAFLDLTDRIKGSKYYDQLNKNVLNAITLDGKLRALPAGTAHPILRYTNTLDPDLQVDNDITWNEILQIGLDYPDKFLFGSVENGRDRVLVSNLFEANIYDMVDFEAKTANLHEPWFMEALEKLRAVYRQGNLTTLIPLTFNYNVDYSNRDYFFECLTMQGVIENYTTEYEDANGEVTLMSMPRGEKSSNRFAYAFQMYAISSNSKKQDAAWDLLEFLVSFEPQMLIELNAVPVNLQATNTRLWWYFDNPIEELERQFDTVYNDIEYLYDTSSYRIQAAPILCKYVLGTAELEEVLKEAEYEIWLLLNE